MLSACVAYEAVELYVISSGTDLVVVWIGLGQCGVFEPLS